jgi:NAD(P)-dependent dehydrogenase (short-subunit alcohol dehydrogenase family)
MPSKICVVTGANSGIGKETARGLAQRGYTVVLACRDSARADAARDELSAATGNPSISTMRLDLASITSIDGFVIELRQRFGRLDLLVNNAGVLWRRRTLIENGLEATFAVNHLGHFALTLGLLELLEQNAPSRVVMVSSKLHAGAELDLDDLAYEKRSYGGFNAYNASKLANVIFAKALARRLGKSGVCVSAVHPGDAATQIARDYGRAMMTMMKLLYRSPKVAGSSTLHAATAPEANVSGAFYRDCRVVESAPITEDVAMQDRLWALSEELIRVARSVPERSSKAALP